MEPHASNPFLPRLLTLSALISSPLAHAADGTWLGSSGDWGASGTWTGGTIADGADFTANFTGVNIAADQTITLDADRTIGNITFTDATTSSHNLTITGSNTLTLDRTSGVPTIDVTQTGRTLAISSKISDSDGLQKNGTGTLSLSGDNNYTGTTVISNGILAISHNNALGSTSGNTTITATGASTGPQLALSGNINSAENISINGNSDTAQYNAAIYNTSGTNTLSGNITLASPTGTGIRITSGGGELILAGAVSQTGTSKNLVLQALSGASITVNNAIANNNGGLNILGNAGGATGTVTLKAASTAIGTTTVGENGTLKLGVTDALKTTANLTLGFAYNFTGSDYGTFDLAGYNQTVAALIGTKNTSNIGADSKRIVTNSAASGTSLLTVGNNNATGVFNGVILDGATAAVALTKIGTGTQTLAGDSNYSGVTTISVGTLAITHGNALGSTAGNTTIAANGNTNGGILSLSGNINSAENITITGATEKNSYMAAISNTSGNNTLSGNITLASPTGGIRLGTSGGSLTFSGNISQTGTSQGLAFQAQNTSTIVVNNPIALNGGNLAIYSYGAGTNSVTLKGVNGAGGIGNTTISQSGTLKLGVTNALNTSSNLEIGVGAASTDTGTFDLAGFDQTVNALNGVGTVASNSNRKVINSVAGTKTLTVGNGGGTGAFNGVILTGTGEVALVKTGGGTQTLNGTNTSTGGTRIDGGILALGHATDTLANTGAVNVNGGTLSIGANSDTVGAVTLTSGSITGSTGTLTGTGSAYDVRSGTINAKLGGTVGLTKTTGSTVTINSASSYTGATNVNEGKLVVDGNISTSTLTTVAVDATLGGSGTVGKTIINGTLAVGNSPGQMNFTDTLSLAGSTIMEIDGTSGAGVTGGHDFVNLTGVGTAGVLTYGGTMTIDIGVIFDDGTYSWNLFDMSGEAGTFTGITLADQYSGNLLDADLNGVWNLTSGGNTWTFTESTGVLDLTVVPEPRAALLGGLGLLMLLRRRRS